MAKNTRPVPTCQFNADCGDIILRLIANYPSIGWEEPRVDAQDVLEWIINELWPMFEGPYSELVWDRAEKGTPSPCPAPVPPCKATARVKQSAGARTKREKKS